MKQTNTIDISERTLESFDLGPQERARLWDTRLPGFGVTIGKKKVTFVVQRRIKGDKATSAYLSGGLDSRLCVAALIHDDVTVHSFNFARPGTQDCLFGNDFAEKIGAIHQTIYATAGL